MFSGMQNGFTIVCSSIKFFFKYPKTIVPIFLSWILIGVSIWYFGSIYDMANLSVTRFLLFVFIYFFSITLLVTLSSLILLELIEQHETDGEMKMGKAIKDALSRDLLRALPIIILWSLIKIFILIIETAFSTYRRNYNLRTKTSGDNYWSRGRLLTNSIRTGVQMGFMLAFAAIAWEELPVKQSISKGMKIYKSHFATMATGVGLSQLLSFITFIPLLLYFLGIGYMDFPVTNGVFYFFLIYIGFTWSFSIIVEQTFTAELYLWERKFEIELQQAKMQNEEGPQTMKDIKRPSLLDDIPDLIFKNVNTARPDYSYTLED